MTSAAGPHDPVDNREPLYRLVRPIYVKPENGGWRLSAQAFTDPFPRCRISVDRAWLCSNNPAHVKVDEDDLVCSVGAEESRAIKSVTHNKPSGELIRRHDVHIDPVPKDDDDAHAEIYACPQVPTKGVFRKLQERLAQLAQWEAGHGPSDTS